MFFVLSKFFISWVGLMNCFVGFFKATSPLCFCACFISCFNHCRIKTNFEWLVQKMASQIKILDLIFYSSYQVRVIYLLTKLINATRLLLFAHFEKVSSLSSLFIAMVLLLRKFMVFGTFCFRIFCFTRLDQT